MGYLLAFPYLIVAVVLQATLLPRLDLVGEGPDLVYLMVVAWALNAPLRQAVFWGIAGGVLFDLMSAIPLGTTSLGLALMVLLMDTVRMRFYELSWLFLGLMGLFGTLIYEFYRMAMLDVFHLLGLMPADAPFQITWGDELVGRAAPVMLYNVVLVLPVYLLLRASQRRLPVEP